MPVRHFRCFLAVVAMTVGGASAFVPAAPATVIPNQWTPAMGAFSSPVVQPPASRSSGRSVGGGSRRSLHVLQSAKVIPYAFRSVSAALAVRAAKAWSNSPLDSLVMLATASLGWFNFPDLDNDRLKAAKRAVKRLEGTPGDDLEAATKYKKAVRVKVFGQFLSLLWMACCAAPGRRALLGAAIVVAPTLAFMVLGGGTHAHNASGRWKPIDAKHASFIYKLDGSVVAAAVVAAFLEPSRLWRKVGAWYVALTCFGGALQPLLQAKSTKPAPSKSTEETKEEEDPLEN